MIRLRQNRLTRQTCSQRVKSSFTNSRPRAYHKPDLIIETTSPKCNSAKSCFFNAHVTTRFRPRYYPLHNFTQKRLLWDSINKAKTAWQHYRQKEETNTHETAIQELFVASAKALKDGNIKEALSNAKKALDLAPNSPKVLSKCLAILIAYPVGMESEILSIVNKLEEMSPSESLRICKFAKAVVEYHKGNVKSALRNALLTLQCDASKAEFDFKIPDSEVLELAMPLYATLGAKLSVQEIWSKYRYQLTPDVSPAMAALACEILYKAGGDADGWLLTCLQKFPMDPNIWLFAALRAYQNKDFDQCIEIMSLKNILSVNPSYAADLLVFAAAYIKLNHYDMALQFLDNAVEMFPDILSLRVWKLKLSNHLNPSDIKAYKDFYDAVQPLRVGQDEQWRKLAYLALCSMKLQHSPEAVFRLIKEAQLEEPLTSVEYKLESVVNAIATPENNASEMELLAIDHEELDKHVLSRISSYDSEQLFMLYLREAEVALGRDEYSTATRFAKLAMEARPNHSSAHQLYIASLQNQDKINAIIEAARNINGGSYRIYAYYASQLLRYGTEPEHFKLCINLCKSAWDSANTAFSRQHILSLFIETLLRLSISDRSHLHTALQDLVAQIGSVDNLTLANELMRFAEYSFVTADMQHILLATCDKLLSENNLNVEYQIAKARLDALLRRENNIQQLVENASQLQSNHRIELADIIAMHQKQMKLATKVLTCRPTPPDAMLTLYPLAVLLRSIDNKEPALTYEEIQGLEAFNDDQIALIQIMESIKKQDSVASTTVQDKSRTLHTDVVQTFKAFTAITSLPTSTQYYVLRQLVKHRQGHLLQYFSKQDLQLFEQGIPVRKDNNLDRFIDKYTNCTD